MTTVVYDGKCIAFDSQVTLRDTGIKKYVDKSLKDVNGGIYIFIGNLADGFVLKETFELGKNIALKDVNIEAVYIYPNGNIAFRGVKNNRFIEYSITNPDAFGSGTEAALVALNLGCDAKGAVLQASRVDLYTGGEIRVIELDPIKERIK